MRRLAAPRPLLRGLITLLVAPTLALLVGSAVSTFAQDSIGDDAQPAPPSIGADIPVTYFGPPPSSVQKELVGPYQLIKAGTIDFDAGTLTLPLYRGELRDGRSVWYILTDTTDRAAADALGINFANKLAYASTGRAVRTAELRQEALLVFDQGAVDFSPEHVLVPGAEPNPFPPAEFQPGSVGDEFYSPLVRIVNQAGQPVYNAPVVAFDVDAEEIAFCEGNVDHSKVHDKVVRICPEGNGGGTVTLQMTVGFSFAKPVFYLSTDANAALPAAMETATLAPALNDLTQGRDDSFASPVERLFAVVNGPRGAENPQRQGFNSALGDGVAGGPLNLLGGIPTVATDYSPIWDLNVGAWTQEAVDKGYGSRMIDEFQFLGMVQRGFITGPGGAPFGSSGFFVNCPIVHRFL
jgi:hypothetical protein